MIDVEESTSLTPEEAGRRLILKLEDSEQESTLYHPIRRKIIEVLSSGILDFQVSTDLREDILDDGTAISHMVSTRTPFQRYWMTVAEILDAIERSHPKIKVTKHRCYYHLDKLMALGLVEQYPPVSSNKDGNRQRVRGRSFRTTARFFISGLRGMSSQLSERILNILDNCWGFDTTRLERSRLRELLHSLDETIVSMMGCIASNMKGSSTEYMLIPLVLEQLALLLLSDDERFIALQREAKRILASNGQLLGTNTIETVLHDNDESLGGS